MDRLASALCSRQDAEEWLREALEVAWGVQGVHELPRPRRQLALQRTIGTLLWIQDNHGDVAFMLDTRSVVADAFARFWGGIVLKGPPWRLDPADGDDMPTREEWDSLASFGV